MENETKYTKLSALVNDTFMVEKVWGYTFKMWDNIESKMLTSDTWQTGYRKLHQVDTDKGKLDLSSSQMGSLLEGVMKDGIANINGKTFEVKSNGKTGKEIRYWLNPAKNTNAPEPKSQDEADDGLDQAREEYFEG